jgi:hypothetical protein
MISRILFSLVALFFVFGQAVALEKFDCSKFELNNNQVQYFESNSILYLAGTEKQLNFKEKEKHEDAKLTLMLYKGLSDFIKKKYQYSAFNIELSEVSFYNTSCKGTSLYVYLLPLKNLKVKKVDPTSDQKNNLDDIEIKEIKDPFEDFK